MDKRTKIIVGLFVVVLLGIIITEIVRPKPLDWNPSYTSGAKVPFGCHVLFQELPTLFKNQKIKEVNDSFYNLLASRDSTTLSNYMIINDQLSLDKQESAQLLEYVAQGNDAFIAANTFGAYLSDTLNLKVKTEYTITEDTLSAKLTNKSFQKETFYYTRGGYRTYFTSVDTLNTTLLGHLTPSPGNASKTANFIRTRFGKGNFYLSTIPQAYTNYYMLKGNQDYVAHTFSYLGDRSLFWDNYKKSGRVMINSPMRFVLSQAALKWAYYLSLFGVLLFVIFRGKRQQRIIPIIAPLENTSVAFARTVGSLYYQQHGHTDLIHKKLNFFLEHIRSHYYMDISSVTERTATDLAARSNRSVQETKALLDTIVYLRNKDRHTQEDLVLLHNKITSFKN
jgi:hypothetical protein